MQKKRIKYMPEFRDSIMKTFKKPTADQPKVFESKSNAKDDLKAQSLPEVGRD